MMKVQLIAHTPEPEKIVAAAAKLCYSQVGVEELMQGLTPEKTAEFVQMLASLGHESPTEHVSFTFAIEGVSRSLLAQITRHRIASYSVQSQRYVRLNEFDYVTPPEIAENEEAQAAYDEMMAQQAESYR
ncbi:MAG: FAD-dependent thymidylate synthase, partial [Pygmaiobacter massiliensis]